MKEGARKLISAMEPLMPILGAYLWLVCVLAWAWVSAKG